MHSSVGKYVILSIPFLIVSFFLIRAWMDSRRGALAAGPGFFQRNGVPVATFMLIAVGAWTLLMIVLPLLSMVDLSFRPKLPPPQWGGPKDFYTLEHYRFFLFGPASEDGWNVVHLKAFAITIFAAVVITVIDFVICYPIAFFMAKSASRNTRRMMMLMLIAPYWVNEILRAFAFRVMFAEQGIINNILVGIGIIDSPVDFIGQDIALNSGLAYAYVLLMMFSLYNAIETLDGSLLEAARDLGAPWWHIHAFIVIPHAKPGIASGATLVFMLTAGALAAPLVLGGPNSLWFTPIVYDRFYQAFNWQQGAAYALILLIACVIFVMGVSRIFKLGIGEIAR